MTCLESALANLYLRRSSGGALGKLWLHDFGKILNYLFGINWLVRWWNPDSLVGIFSLSLAWARAHLHLEPLWKLCKCRIWIWVSLFFTIAYLLDVAYFQLLLLGERACLSLYTKFFLRNFKSTIICTTVCGFLTSHSSVVLQHCLPQHLIVKNFTLKNVQFQSFYMRLLKTSNFKIMDGIF